MLLHRRQVLAWPSAPPVLMAEPDTAAPAKAKPTALKKGALVRVKRQAYAGSVEAGASDPNPPEYIFEGPGEILVVKGDFAQVRWGLVAVAGDTPIWGISVDEPLEVLVPLVQALSAQVAADLGRPIPAPDATRCTTDFVGPGTPSPRPRWPRPSSCLPAPRA